MPAVFTPIVLESYAGSCGYERPDWLDEAFASRKQSPRRYHIASEMNAYLDRDAEHYIHLVDGGIADNLGVRGPLDNVIVEGGIWKRFQDLGAERPQHLVFIVVDASTNPDRSFEAFPRPPSLASLIGSVTNTQLHRYNFETMELLYESMQRWAGQFSADAAPVKTHLVEVAEYAIDDPEERAFFDGVPTALSLDDETVDRLIALGRRLLRESEEFQGLLAELRAENPAEGP